MTVVVSIICYYVFFFSLVKNQSVGDKSPTVSPPRHVMQQPPPPNNRIHPQTDFTSPPPTKRHRFWPQQAFFNTRPTQYRMPSPGPQAKSTVTNTITCNNNPPTFSASSNSAIRSPSPRWSSFVSSSRQRTPYLYGITPTNNFQNAVCLLSFITYVLLV